MAREKSSGLYLTVPSFFKCPISMDVMTSPVSLSTGVTYDRVSIQKWLEAGHNTCPATMQVLQSTDVVPNLTLRRLIRVWSDSYLLRRENHATTFDNELSLEELKDLIINQEYMSLSTLNNVVSFAKSSRENCELLVRLEGFFAKVVNMLRQRSLEGKISAARVLETLAALDTEYRRLVADDSVTLAELYRLTMSHDVTAVNAGLTALITVATSRQTKKELVRLGIVKTAGKMLAGPEKSVSVIEKVLKLLEMVSTCTEGRTAICEDENCVSGAVNRLMKVSPAATEHAICVIWSVCYMSRDRTAQEAAVKMNGLTKILLVMQSNVSGLVRQMCGELVKVLRVNSKSCLASYETRTTHIMPY
ncbi:ARM repeat superfamily protein [Artemisia annua]|uniref:U-box domain-containing protein n=1 Tax=Artemisia annua TaxID=35608 RepID=A0A2U1LDW9_ARTAN|nr:ARM repeat superfamily protein [Artemisia annua]